MPVNKIKSKDLIEMEEKLHGYKGQDRIVSSQEVADELAKTEESSFKIKTGFDSLDRILDGVEAGELITVTGPTGHGKTTLLMSITVNMIKAAVRSVWFTLEVTPRQFIKKIVSATDDKESIPTFYMPRRGMEDVDPEFVEWWQKKTGRKFDMIDWIEAKILEAVNKENVRVVFIDHIHSIFSLERMGQRNLSLEIGDMVAKIKQMAIDYNLVIFLIAHCKDPHDGVAREPRMEDIRDSGLVSRNSDTVLGVWRIRNEDDGTNTRMKETEEADNKAKVRIFKNRREGKKGFFTAYHDHHYFSEDAFFGLKSSGESVDNIDFTK